jgi:hypothetical protein
MAGTITTKATKIMRSTRLKRAAAAIIGHETGTEPRVQKTFLAWCAMPVSEGGLATVISALYYLPQNFMLMIPRAVAKGNRLSALLASSAIKSQVQFYEDKDSSTDGSFSLADVVIGGETDNSLAIMPAASYSPLAVKDFSFAVGRSPEAIASSLLKFARDDA